MFNLKNNKMSKKEILEIFENTTDSHGMKFICARLISGSKSSYMKAHSENRVIFNSNIIVKGSGKVWYGDLDLDIDKNELINISNKIGKKLYILREMDGRFENENKSEKKLINKSVAVVDNEKILYYDFLKDEWIKI